MSALLIGILNITPDSFSDGGEFVEPAVALARAEALFANGASIIDVGAEATNPKAGPLNIDEEWTRLEPILQELLLKYPGKISIDTRHAEIVEQAAEISSDFIVNDVTTFIDPAMIAVTAKYGLRAIVSHLPLAAKGDIQWVHKESLVDDLEQVRRELLAQKAKMIGGGIIAENIIIDPGIGFGKAAELNWKLLEFAKYVPGETVLIGHSRKRFLGENRFEIEPNLKAAQLAMASGAAYLRVHDPEIYQELFVT
jgi:dihydropteroate synthase